MVEVIYTVDAERSGRWWSLQCREVPGAISQVARLDQAADGIREAIAWVAEVAESEVEVQVIPHLPTGATRHLAAAQRLRERSAEANRKAAEESRAAVAELASAGLSVRDMGVVLGISHQRAQQLLSEIKARDPQAAAKVADSKTRRREPR